MLATQKCVFVKKTPDFSVENFVSRKVHCVEQRFS
jgi:hypothetical protein